MPTIVLTIMSAKPQPSTKEKVPAARTEVTTGEGATQPPNQEPGVRPGPVGQDESEHERSANRKSLPAEQSLNSYESGNPTLNEVAAHPFAPGERIPIHLYDEESFGKKLSHWGPTITSLASIVLTLFVWVNARKLSEQQIALQDRQTQLQDEQVKAELADMRSKFFNDLTSTDENKKTLAEIGLAGHGLKAMPVVHLALAVEQGEIRRSAVNVVYRLFQAEMTLDGRRQLVEQLKEEFDSPNESLHIGVAQSLVKIEPLMNSDERQQIINFFQERILPKSTCSKDEGREVVQEIAKFFSTKDANSVPYLLAIAECPKCGDGWLQAMLKLCAVGMEMQPSQRADLLGRVQLVRSEVLKSLREQTSDEDLSKGIGFGGFAKKGQLTPGFVEFRQRVDEEFESLAQQLGKK